MLRCRVPGNARPQRRQYRASHGFAAPHALFEQIFSRGEADALIPQSELRPRTINLTTDTTAHPPNRTAVTAMTAMAMKKMPRASVIIS